MTDWLQSNLVILAPRYDCEDWLGDLVDHPITVAVAGDQVWLRLAVEEAQRSEAQLRRVPGRRYRVDNGRLVRLGNRVAERRLPDLEWQPIAECVRIHTPAAALAGVLKSADAPHLELIDGGAERVASAAIVDAGTLLDWVHRTADFRLNRLRFAVSGDDCLVIGDPLPPVLRCSFYACGRLLVPAGKRWWPALPAEEILQAFAVEASDAFLLWQSTEHWSTVSADCLQPLSRSSVRQMVGAAAASAERSDE